MAGIEDLKILLSSMKPELDSREFVFCTFDNPLSMEAITNLTPIGTFREKEGLTLIITTDDALSNGIRFDTVYKLISLTVHSSLNAVGLTAAIATKLASKDISANVVAAYYHDHIFIQKEKAGQAMEAIMELQAESFSCRE